MTSASTVARRACAALAAASAGLHAAMLGHSSSVIAAGQLATMIVACLYCARELWRDGTARAWVVVAATAALYAGSRDRALQLSGTPDR
ncbi:MAG: hypothetical protein ACXWZI_15145 [Mycobacterium sp.]